MLPYIMLPTLALFHSNFFFCGDLQFRR